MVCRLFNNRALTGKAIYKKVYPTNKNLNMAMKPNKCICLYAFVRLHHDIESVQCMVMDYLNKKNLLLLCLNNKYIYQHMHKFYVYSAPHKHTHTHTHTHT
jgi:hypothetical protein